MKCDRYIGTGATQRIQKDGKSLANTISPTRHPTLMANAKSQTPRRSQASLFEAEPGQQSRKSSLQVPALSKIPKSPSLSPSPTPSAVLIKEVFSDFDSNRKDTPERQANHCIVIEMHRLKSNDSESNDLEKDNADDENQLTTIKEYEVKMILG